MLIDRCFVSFVFVSICLMIIRWVSRWFHSFVLAMFCLSIRWVLPLFLCRSGVDDSLMIGLFFVARFYFLFMILELWWFCHRCVSCSFAGDGAQQSRRHQRTNQTTIQYKKNQRSNTTEHHQLNNQNSTKQQRKTKTNGSRQPTKNKNEWTKRPTTNQPTIW